MNRSVLWSAVGLTVLLLSVTAQASFIVENRATGQNYASWHTTGGWATSGGNVNAPGCTLNIGSMYSGTGTYFGPSRMGVFAFTPGETGLYQVDLGWTLSAAQEDTAVVLYTGGDTGGPADPWNNTNGPSDVITRTTVNMYNNGTSGTTAGVWHPVLLDVSMTAGTTYKVGIYGGHIEGSPANRVTVGAAQFTLVPEPATLALLGLGGLLLSFRRR